MIHDRTWLIDKLFFFRDCFETVSHLAHSQAKPLRNNSRPYMAHSQSITTRDASRPTVPARQVPLSARHRGQSSTGDMREVTEAWPESADHRTDGANDGIGATLHRSVYQPGVGKNPRDVSESRRGALPCLHVYILLLISMFTSLHLYIFTCLRVYPVFVNAL